MADRPRIEFGLDLPEPPTASELEEERKKHQQRCEGPGRGGLRPSLASLGASSAAVGATAS
jgi:hypothetical protein